MSLHIRLKYGAGCAQNHPPNNTRSWCSNFLSPVNGAPFTLIFAPDVPGFMTNSSFSYVIVACSFWMLKVVFEADSVWSLSLSKIFICTSCRKQQKTTIAEANIGMRIWIARPKSTNTSNRSKRRWAPHWRPCGRFGSVCPFRSCAWSPLRAWGPHWDWQNESPSFCCSRVVPPTLDLPTVTKCKSGVQKNAWSSNRD